MSEHPGDLVIEDFSGSPEEWDEALAGLPGATVCHRYGWRSVMENGLGHTCYFWAARDRDGTIVGLLPLVRVRSRLFGDYLVSMPFLNDGGPVGSESVRVALAERAEEHARALGVQLLELRTRSALEGTPLATNPRKLTVLKDLPESSEELWEKGIKSKIRSQVRRPMKEGMEIRIGPDRLDDFYRVFSTTMRDLGTPVLPKHFFQAIANALPDSVLFAVVEHQGEPAAAACCLVYQDEMEITWAGASRTHQRLAPNMLLYWGVMEAAVERGLSVFNFGRCSPDSGTHRFKKQWGSEDLALPWLQWSSSGATSTPTPTGAKYRLATSAWQKLPVPITNVIGPPLSRLIP